MLFLSTYHNKIDKKGRVSVPAPFRAALLEAEGLEAEASKSAEFSGIIAYASFVNPCIEACGRGRIEALSRRIEALDPFSEERDAFATTILGGSVPLAFDGEGRITLPESLLATASLKESVTFIGKGETFELWESTAFTAYAAQSRLLARDKRAVLRASAPHPGGLV